MIPSKVYGRERRVKVHVHLLHRLAPERVDLHLTWVDCAARCGPTAAFMHEEHVCLVGRQ
eukprot:scaffold36392_cov30-Tisochrysis_lutea.AAC.5